MIDVPPSWLDAVSRTHAPRWRAQVLHGDGSTAIPDLPVTGGQIVRDESGTPRTEASVDIPTTAAPTLLDQSLLPTGGRLVLQYSVNGEPWATMADLDMVSSTIARPDDMWTLAAVDRSARAAADDLGRAAVPDYTGQTIAAAITGLFRRTFPGAPAAITGPATTRTVPAGYEIGFDGDPWQAVQDLAEEAESEAFVSGHTRVLTVRPIPGAGDPVDRVAVGPSGVLTGYVVHHELAVNTVSVQYRNKDDVLLRRGLAVDTRPDSPNAVQRVGCNVTHNETIRADAAPSQADADAAAAAVLRRMSGRARAAELRHPARPWLEPGDTVLIGFLGGPEERQVVASVGIDLGPDNIQVTRLRNSDYQMSEVLP